jgi:membrane protein implicated in regulation of membrane protease activity
MEFLQNIPTWQLFSVIGVLLSVAEIFIPGFIVLPIGIGFLISAPIVFFVSSSLIQYLVLAAVEFLMLFLLLKYRPRGSRPTVYSNAEGMIGQECEVIEAVTTKKLGYVKLYGDRWQASSYNLQGFQVGEKAIIAKIVGNKVQIEKLNHLGEI